MQEHNQKSKPLPEKLDSYDYLYKCPITLEPPRNPVVALDGTTYEQENYEDWKRKNATSPKTRQPLDAPTYRNFALEETQNTIEELVERCNDQGDAIKQLQEELKQEVRQNFVDNSIVNNQIHNAIKNDVAPVLVDNTKIEPGPIGVVLQGVGGGVVVGGLAAGAGIAALGVESFGALALTTLTSIGVEAGLLGGISAFLGPVGIGIGIVIGVGAIVGALGYSAYKVISSKNAQQPENAQQVPAIQ